MWEKQAALIRVKILPFGYSAAVQNALGIANTVGCVS